MGRAAILLVLLLVLVLVLEEVWPPQPDGATRRKTAEHGHEQDGGIILGAHTRWRRCGGGSTGGSFLPRSVGSRCLPALDIGLEVPDSAPQRPLTRLRGLQPPQLCQRWAIEAESTVDDRAHQLAVPYRLA